MDSSLIAIVCGGFPAVLWGVGNFLGAKSAKAIGPRTTTYYLQWILALTYSVVFLLFLRTSATFNVSGVEFAVASGLAFVGGLNFLYAGLAVGPVSIVTPVTFAYPLITALLAFTLFGATVSGTQILAILVIVGGAAAAAGLLDLNKSERRLGRGPILAVFAALMYGLAFALTAQSVKRMGWQSATLIQTWAGVGFFSAILPFIQREERVLKSLKLVLKNKPLIICGLMGVTGGVITNIGFGFDKASSGALVTAASSVSPIVTVILALKHFEEEFKPSRLIGAAVTVLGVILLSIG